MSPNQDLINSEPTTLGPLFPDDTLDNPENSTTTSFAGNGGVGEEEPQPPAVQETAIASDSDLGEDFQPTLLTNSVNLVESPQSPDPSELPPADTDTVIGGEARVGVTDSLTGAERTEPDDSATYENSPHIATENSDESRGGAPVPAPDGLDPENSDESRGGAPAIASASIAAHYDNPQNANTINITGENEEIFDSGVFEVVSPDGQVGFDFLYDGGWYRGEVALFGINGLDQYRTSSVGFLTEVLRRSLGHSDEPGEIVIADAEEGSRFSGELGDPDQNQGEYLGVKNFQLSQGDKFGLVLIPNGTVQEVLGYLEQAQELEAAGEANPLRAIPGNLRPLFSINIANPEGVSHVGQAADYMFAEGQIADVTRDGHTFVMEDLRADRGGSDKDYNDLIFQVRGAKGKAQPLDELIDPEKDWTDSDLGKAIQDYADLGVKVAEGEVENDPILSNLSTPVQVAIENAGDLDNYDSEELVDLTEWVVAVNPELDPDSIALLLGGENLGESGHIENTYIYKFPEDTSAEDIKKHLEDMVGSDIGYPLVPVDLISQPFVTNDPLFGDQWHLDNTGQDGGTQGADLNILDAWQLELINKGFAGAGYTGEGTVVGIVDSGVQEWHPDLADNYRPDLSFDFNDIDPSQLEGAPTPLEEEWWWFWQRFFWGWFRYGSYSWWRWADDSQGEGDRSQTSEPLQHGTSVAGIVAGVRNNEEGVSGVAPNAEFASLGLTAEEVTDLQIADAFGHEQQVIDIFNNSWKPGRAQLAAPLSLNELEKGAKEGRTDDNGNALGNIYVFAAGNDGWAGEDVNYNPFANSRFTIAVGAIDNKGEQAWYSEPGAALLVSAYSSSTSEEAEGQGAGEQGDAQNPNSQDSESDDPEGEAPPETTSVGIATTDLAGEAGYDEGNYTDNFGGTSAAAPMVSGVTALMLEANPNLTWRDVQHILVETSEQNHANDDGWTENGAGYEVNHNYGFGAVDATAAVRYAETWNSVGEEIEVNSIRQNVNQSIPDYNTEALLKDFLVTNDPDLNPILDFLNQEPTDPDLPPANPLTAQQQDKLRQALGNANTDYLESKINITEDINIEWVEVEFDATHSYRGDLKIVLVSPDGTESVLANRHADPGSDSNSYKWVFTSARHWGESSQGEWTLRVSDERGEEIGDWNSWGLNFFGTENTTAVSIEAIDSSATEGAEAGVLAVKRTEENLDRALEVSYSIAGTATNGSDYVVGAKHSAGDSSPTPNSGGNASPLQGTVTIPAGEIHATIPIVPNSDYELELDETVEITLVDGRGYSVDASQDSAAVTLTENSVLSSYGPFVYENPDNGHLYILSDPDTWHGAQAQAEAIGGNLVTINDRAEQDWIEETFGEQRLLIGLTDSEIYGQSEGNFGWVSGEELTYEDWKVGEPNNLNGRQHVAATYGGKWDDINDRTTGNLEKFPGIIEIDPATQGETIVNIQVTDPSAGEDGNAGQLLIQRIGSMNADLTVNYSLDGDATNGADYAELTGTAIIPAGQSLLTIPIIALSDSEVEDNETLVVTLESGDYRVGTHGSGHVVLSDQHPINRIGNEVIGRNVDLVYWNQRWQDGETLEQIRVAIIAAANDGQGNYEAETKINAIYRDVLGRDAEAAEIAQERSRLETGATLSQVRQSLEGGNAIDVTSDIYTHPETGHKYFLTAGDTWLGAQEQAKLAGGNLVSINDIGEQQWLEATFDNAPDGLKVYDHKANFLGQTGATAISQFTNPGSSLPSFTLDGLTFSTVAPDVFPSSREWSTRLPGSELAVNGTEHLNIDLANPVNFFGFDFVEPEFDPRVNSTFVDSKFEVTLLSGGTAVDSFEFEPPNDIASFVGFSSGETFDRVEIREIVGHYENEFFGNFYTGVASLDTLLIGLNDSPIYGQGEGDYRWVDDSEVSYSNWSPGFPNNSASGGPEGEDFTWISGGSKGGKWNDTWINNSAAPRYGIVEIPVEPAAATFLNPDTPYLRKEDSPFYGETFTYFHLEDFEDGALNTPGVNVSAGSIIPSAFMDSVDGDDGTLDGSGSSGQSFWGSNKEPAIEFSFDKQILGELPTHAGVAVTDALSETVTLEAFDALGASLGVTTYDFVNQGPHGNTDEDRFLGFTHLGGISAIKITRANNIPSSWEVDHLQYGLATPTLNIEVTDPDASESSDGGYMVVTRSGDTSQEITVNYTLGGSATSGADYQNPGNIVIAAGEIEAIIAIKPTDDTAAEGSETVTATLGASADYALGSKLSGTVTISDDEPSYNWTWTSFGEDLNPQGNNGVLANTPNVDNARNAFLANLIDIETEDFESFADGDSPSSLTFGSETATLSGVTSIADFSTGKYSSGGGSYPISGDKYLLHYHHSNTFTLDFGKPQSAVGFTLTDAGDLGGQLILTLHHEDGTTEDLPVPHKHQVYQNSGSAVFFGVTDIEKPLTAITFTNTRLDGFGLDDLIVGQVNPNRPATATPPNQTLNLIYTEDETLDLVDIVVTDPDGQTKVSLTLSDPAAGTLQAGAVQSATGVWEASGTVTDVNALLANLQFVPAADYNSDLTVALEVSDATSGGGSPLTGTINLQGIAVNDAPNLTAVANSTGAVENQPYTITYENLLALSDASDPDGDAISFQISAVASGTLTKDGAAVIPGTTALAAGESLVWLPDSAGDAVSAFSISATDGSASSAAVPVNIDVAENPATFHNPNASYLSFADSPFNGQNFDYFHLEDFEDGALNVPGVTVSNGVASIPHHNMDSVDGDDGAIDGDGSGGRSWWPSFSEQSITFTFDKNTLGELPTHAGVAWTDGPTASITLEAFDAEGNSLGISNPTEVIWKDVRVDTEEDRFFGASYAGGISKIKLSADGTTNSSWEIDHLQYGQQNSSLVLFPGGSQPTNLVQNGDLEAVDVSGAWQYLWPSTVPADFNWSVANGYAELINETWSGVSGTSNPDGFDQTISLDDATQISQSFATEVGKTYELSFWYSHDPNSSASTGHIDVTGNNSLLSTTLTHDTPTTHDNMQFVQHTATFIADSNSTTLSFQGDAANSVTGFVIDDVRVVPGGTQPPEVTISATDADASEYQNPGEFTISRSGNTDEALSVTYITRGTAGSGTDYQAIPGTATIPVGASSATIEIAPITDGEVEESETVVLNLVGNSGYKLGTDSSATVNIANNNLLTVANTNDSGSGSLRAAIEWANANPGLDTIQFAIPTTDANYNSSTGAFTIQPNSALPTISDSIVIDGTTQTGYASSPLIELSGTNAGTTNGLTISAGDSTVLGLAINRFSEYGILLNGSDGNLVAENYLGTDVTGTQALGNGLDGLQIDDIANNTIDSNLISGNFHGIYVKGSNATGNEILGNYIGTDITGTQDLGNSREGIQINSPGNTVGGTESGDRNLISGNDREGILIKNANAIHNKVLGNYIGTDVTGTLDLGNAHDGIQIDSSRNNIIGGTAPGSGNLISGNDYRGIYLNGEDATGNQILGNYVGTDVTGTVDLGNTHEGVQIRNGSNNIVGGSTAESRNLISGNDQYGIYINGNQATNNQILGNYIGTDITGKVDLGNANDGVLVSGAANNTIGGTSSGSRNLVSGNDGQGIRLYGSNATGNKVIGNYVGTDVTGTADLGNDGSGLVIYEGSNNVVGGTESGSGNLISGNDYTGVRIAGSNALNNQVLGNYIGTDVTGTKDLGNTDAGVLVSESADNNTIGGITPESRNIISGNDAEGVFIKEAGPTGNKILGNYIGTDVTGTLDLGNRVEGLVIQDSPNNIVGGTDSGSRNVISGNDDDGVLIAGSNATNNQILGNYIGTDATGTQDLGNAEQGLYILEAANNIIGGTSTGAGNLISGNDQRGIYVSGSSATDNKILGNYVGTDITGTQDLGNTRDGLIINNAPNNIVGGIESGSRNLISGNEERGIYIIGADATGNQVLGNYVGTDLSGTQDLGNNYDGLFISSAPNNIVGGTESGAGNLISGNDQRGIHIFGTDATGNQLLGNYIGTDVTGSQDLGNSTYGLEINNAPNNIIGGTTAEAQNVISGNDSHGIIIGNSGATGNQVLGNYVGTDKTGAQDLGNGGEGIYIVNGGSNNSIGGTATGAGNTIAFHDNSPNSDGVTFNTSAGSGNAILGNAIFANNNVGINLDNSLPTPNDPGDADTGANNLQNFPVLSSAIRSDSSTSIEGSLNSSAEGTFRLEFFSNPDSSRQGKTFLGFQEVTTDASGNVSFTANLPTSVPVGSYITATATDSGNNTSEFSSAFAANTAPTVANPNATFTGIVESAPLTITHADLLGASGTSDADGDNLVFRIETVGADIASKNSEAVVPGTTTLAAGESLVWTPTTTGQDQLVFTATVSDGTTEASTPIELKVDVNPVTVSIAATDAEATEGQDPGEFTFTRTGNTAQPLVVTYDIDTNGFWSSPTATNGTDYEELSRSITIPAGASSVTLPINTLDDSEAEWSERLKLYLTQSNGYEIGSQDRDEVKIWDSETPEVLLYVHNSGHYDSSEGGRSGRFLVRRLGSLEDPLEVNYSVAGTATPGTDYTTVGMDYNALTGSITIPAGQHDQYIRAKSIDDTEEEPGETIDITLTPDSDYTIKAGWENQHINLWDNENRSTISISVPDSTATEDGDPGQVLITRSGDTSEAITVHYEVSGDWHNRATNGQDYQLLAESVNFAANQTSATIDINPIDDDLAEVTETVAISIKSDSGYNLSGVYTGRVQILDNETPTTDWQQQLGTAGDDLGNSVAVDSAGNVYVTGSTTGDLSGTNAGSSDAFIAKRDSNGNELWNLQFGTANADEARDIEIDSAGNLYIAGWTDSPTPEAWIAKYDSDGNEQWQKSLGSADYDISNGAMTIGSDGSLYLTGRTSGNLEGTNQGQLDAWVAKFDSDGNEQWAKQLGTAEDDESYAVTVDASGNVYITGQTKGSLAGTREGDGDAWAAMYDSNGNFQWQTQLGTTTRDTATSISVDNSDRVYLSGQTYGWLGETYAGDVSDWVGDVGDRLSALIGDKEGLGGTYYGEGDAWVAQLDASNGSINWKRLLGTESADGSTGIFADSLGNAYLTGFTQGELVSDSQAGSDDIFLAKYDVNGALLWKKQMGSDGEDIASDIILDGTGVYLTGYTSADLESANQGGKDVWTIKLS